MAERATHTSVLARLNDTRLMLAEDRYDIRGFRVCDRVGGDIGHVDDLFIDETERKVRMLQIRAGGFFGLGERHFLLPVDAVTRVTDGEVHVNVTVEHVIVAPGYDPRLARKPSPTTWGPYYGYYGIAPFWGTGYLYPQFPITDGRPRVAARS